ncbi:unnamed protein product [Blepharisma stoltei]|uniref:TATA box-binding protein-associated factor RNA polymerase I subunit B n=1 Tax=Blepharisma stoltei TaxID=1481888 RepID=A0AAU9K1E5_9CILI|nr:unnamed protein product [Blepharisma stoltei]
MECINCRNTEFFEHSSGYLVCTICFTQAPRFNTLVDETFYSATPTPLKRKVKYATQKSSKIKDTDYKLSWFEYTQAYKSLIEIMLTALIKNKNLKQELKSNANIIWEKILEKLENREVRPKNRRKRDREKPNKYTKTEILFDKKVRQEIEKVCGKGRKGRRPDRFADGVSTRTLINECNKRRLDPKNFDNELNIRDKASILIYIYEEMKRSYPVVFEKIAEETKIENKLVKTFEELNKEHSTTTKGLSLKTPIELSNILIIAYIAMLYTYAENSAVFVTDILEAAYDGTLPYFTSYQELDIPEKFCSLFRPLSLPSEHWIRLTLIEYQQKYDVDVISTFRSYDTFAFNLAIAECKRLSLPSEFSQLSYKLYKKFSEEFNTECFIHTLAEVLIAGCVFLVIKLIYGLNDLPYSIEVYKDSSDAFDANTAEKMKENQDELARKISSFPSLQRLFMLWQDEINEKTHANQVFNLTEENLQNYYSHLQLALDYKPNPVLEVKSIKSEGKNYFPIKVLEKPKSLCNSFLKEEIQHHFSENPEYPLPCCDFIVQKKKKAEKQYPSEYIYALHCVAKLGGNFHTKQLHNVVDKLERIIFKID